MKRLTVLLLSIFAIVGCGKKQEDAYITSVSHPDWMKKAVMYEMNIRDVTPEGTFKAAEGQLERLAAMGIDIIRLNPIFRVGKSCAVLKYNEVDPALGTIDDFSNFVEAANDMGMRVILDLVADRVSAESDLMKINPEIGIVCEDNPDIAILNYETIDLWVKLADVVRFWTLYGADGFCCCGAENVPIDFWNELVRESREEYPDMIFVTAGEMPELQEKGSNAYLAVSQLEEWNLVASGEISADSLANYYVGYDLMPLNTIPVNFTDGIGAGSDMETCTKIMRQFTALSFTVPGMPMVSGLMGKDTVTEDFYRALITLRDKHASLWSQPEGGVMSILPSDRPNAVFAFEREVEGDICLAMFNFSDEEIIFNIDNHITTSDRQFMLPPHGFHIIFAIGDCFGDCDWSEK